MSEEEKKEEVKMSFPMFTNLEEAELERKLEFQLNEFVNEINKTISKDKDIIIFKKVIEKQQKEIEELKDTLKCTQNSWYKDTKVIEKQQKEIEQLKSQNNEIVKELKPRVRIDDTEYIERNFISKDKIRNLLKQVNASLYHFKDSEKNNIVQRVKDKLEQLLEE